MPVSVTLPALGESVTEGTVTRWLKQEGDTVALDEPLLEISTDKVDTEIPSPAAGVLLKISVGEDETVAVGAELGVIGAAGETAAPSTDRVTEAPPAPTQVAPSQMTQPPASAAVPTENSPPDAPAPTAAPAAQHPAGDAGTPVLLPALGESVTEGTVTRWLKQVGDAVEVDEPLLEISTDKVDTEIPSPAAGVLLTVDVSEDQTVAVGARLGLIGPTPTGSASNATTTAPTTAPTTANAAPEPARPAPSAVPPTQPTSAPTAAAPAAPTPPPAPAADAVAGNGHNQSEAIDVSSYVTPLVRKLASDNNIDLARLRGTGVGGRIRKQDVLDAARAAQDAERSRPATPAPSAAPAAALAPSSATALRPISSAPTAPPVLSGTQPMSRLRKVIAARMVESLQVSAQLTTVVEADITRIARLREAAKHGFEAREGQRLSFLPFFARAVVEALKTHPLLNASIDAEHNEITYHSEAHLGIAVDTDRGLLVPVIRHADDLNIAGLTRKIADLAARARNNKIGPDELGGGTFTLTNTGSRGALFDTPILNQPQVGILGTGAVIKRPVVIDDPGLGETIAVRSMVHLALTYDHRLVDGADAARFLTTVKQRLEEAAFEADLGL